MNRENIKLLSRNEARLLVAFMACTPGAAVADMPKLTAWAGITTSAAERSLTRLIQLGFIEIRGEQLFILDRQVVSPKAKEEQSEHAE